MENKLQISLKVNQEFDSLYKLGYFLIDINSVLTFADKINKKTIEEAKKPKKYRFGITSRINNKESLNNIKIEEFQQGSLLLTITAAVIAGVIIEIIKLYINQNRNKEILNVTINHLQISNIHLDNFTLSNFIENIYNKHKPLDENINNIITELNKKNIITDNGLLYDKDGIKILIKNIERIKGQIIDQKW